MLKQVLTCPYVFNYCVRSRVYTYIEKIERKNSKRKPQEGAKDRKIKRQRIKKKSERKKNKAIKNQNKETVESKLDANGNKNGHNINGISENISVCLRIQHHHSTNCPMHHRKFVKDLNRNHHN